MRAPLEFLKGHKLTLGKLLDSPLALNVAVSTLVAEFLQDSSFSENRIKDLADVGLKLLNGQHHIQGILPDLSSHLLGLTWTEASLQLLKVCLLDHLPGLHDDSEGKGLRQNLLRIHNLFC